MLNTEARLALRHMGHPTWEACDALEALDWLESACKIEWWREDRRYFFATSGTEYYSIYDHEGGDEVLKDYPMPFTSPSSLILAVYAQYLKVAVARAS